jgi:iron complex transport system substrate-binding protein
MTTLSNGISDAIYTFSLVGPSGFNRIVIILWTAKVLHPDSFSDRDLPAITRDLYTKFYHYDLLYGEASSLLESSLRVT